MKKVVETKKKRDLEMLFSGQKVEGYEIKPFSFHNIVTLTPWFEKVAINLIKKGIDITAIKDFNLGDANGFIKGINLLPDLPEFFSIYLEEDIKVILNWDFDKTQKIIAVTIYQNFKYLKNSLSLMTATLKALSTKINKDLKKT